MMINGIQSIVLENSKTRCTLNNHGLITIIPADISCKKVFWDLFVLCVNDSIKKQYPETPLK